MIEKSGGEYWDTIVAADGEKLVRYWIKQDD
jgi:predicted acetyltransferase